MSLGLSLSEFKDVMTKAGPDWKTANSVDTRGKTGKMEVPGVSECVNELAGILYKVIRAKEYLWLNKVSKC